MTYIDKAVKEIETKQEELLNKLLYCSEHKFNHEASAIRIELDGIDFALRKIRYHKNQEANQ